MVKMKNWILCFVFLLFFSPMILCFFEGLQMPSTSFGESAFILIMMISFCLSAPQSWYAILAMFVYWMASFRYMKGVSSFKEWSVFSLITGLVSWVFVQSAIVLNDIMNLAHAPLFPECRVENGQYSDAYACWNISSYAWMVRIFLRNFHIQDIVIFLSIFLAVLLLYPAIVTQNRRKAP
ncbi:hypothetical protein KBX73_01935 [Acetobacter persici]|uniref:hypothetical protein n=1 Tax=Acetobacter persici TaxID=1076596 RepID=UPI0020CCEBFA|nr:hypothetical protein [Acetobacter persici]MCP9318548.1 hypothetical protein [Acetobacter persici]